MIACGVIHSSTMSINSLYLPCLIADEGGVELGKMMSDGNTACPPVFKSPSLRLMAHHHLWCTCSQKEREKVSPRQGRYAVALIGVGW